MCLVSDVFISAAGLFFFSLSSFRHSNSREFTISYGLILCPLSQEAEFCQIHPEGFQHPDLTEREDSAHCRSRPFGCRYLFIPVFVYMMCTYSFIYVYEHTSLESPYRTALWFCVVLTNFSFPFNFFRN